MYEHKLKLYIPRSKSLEEYQGEMVFISHYDLHMIETKAEFREHILSEFIKHQKWSRWKKHIIQTASMDHLQVRKLSLSEMIITEVKKEVFESP